MKKIIFTSVLCLLMYGCVSTFKLVPQALNGQQMVNQEGAAVVVSQKKARVMIRPPAATYSSEDRPVMVVGVSGAEKPYDFSTDNIQVFVDGNPHHVFSYDELVEEAKKQQEAKIIEIKSRYDTQTRDVAEQGYKSSSDPEVFTPGESQNTIGDTSKFGYKMDVDAIAKGQGSAKILEVDDVETIEAQTEQTLNALSLSMLKKATVMPDTFYSGHVALDKIVNQAREIKVLVTAAGEKHEFSLNYVKGR